jgi:hypothetical protein
MAEDSRKSELIAELARARSMLAANTRGLRGDLHFGGRVKGVYAGNQYAWLGGAALLGVLLGRRKKRRHEKIVFDKKGRKDAAQEAVVKTGLMVTFLKLIFDVARPVITKWLTKQVTGYATSRMTRRFPR